MIYLSKVMSLIMVFTLLIQNVAWATNNKSAYYEAPFLMKVAKNYNGLSFEKKRELLMEALKKRPQT